MTNLNQELIEKVRQGKAAIKYNDCKGRIEDLRYLIGYLFPKDPMCPKGEADYYYRSETHHHGWVGTLVEKDIEGLEIIPLSAFFTNELPKSDKELIADMNERLKKLEILLDEALAKETPESLTQWLLSKRSIAPVDTKEEVEYVECLNWSGTKYINGRIYPVIDGFISVDVNYKGTEPAALWAWFKGTNCFKLSTISAYLSQQGEQPKEWKEGEWAWIGQDFKRLYFIEKLQNGNFHLNNQKGGIDLVGEEYIYFTKPTPEEIQQHLASIAREKYPVGAKIETKYFQQDDNYVITDAPFEMMGSDLVQYDINDQVGYVLWNSTTQRWIPVIKD